MALNVYHTNVTCPYCGKKSDFTMHSLIDTAIDPSAEQKLFNGSYFRYTCPFCHEEENISYTCLYHNQMDKVLVGLADTVKDETEMLNRFQVKTKEDDLDEALATWITTCKVRLVKNVSDLQEKVLIFHFNLDDRIVEIAKHMTKIIAEEQEPELKIEHLLFNHNGDGYSFVILNEDGVKGEIPFSKENYLLLEQRYGLKLIHTTDLCIDEKWTEEFLLANDAMS